MFYREAGQFKTSYEADSQVFPIRQDRIGVAVLLAVAFVGIPLVGSEYWFSAILIPFLIFRSRRWGSISSRDMPVSCRSVRRRSWRWVRMPRTTSSCAWKACRCC